MGATDAAADGVAVARVLDRLNEEQRAAVLAEGGPLCILAGAGSGKTRVLTSRIAHRSLTGDADPRRVLALTFTRKAAGELRARVRAFGLRDDVTAGTFHAIAYAQLRAWWAATGRRPPELLDRKGPVVARLLSGGSKAHVLDVVAEIEWAQARLVPPDGYVAAIEAAERRTPIGPGVVAGVYRRYEEEKRRRGLVDFDDLLARCAEVLQTDAEFAAAQRWRHRHLFVDEFQDVNPLQLSLLRAWLGDRTDLCVVGDPNQAIYGWNGADPRFIRDFPRHFTGGTVLHLRRNHRSTPQILTVAGAALGVRSAGIATRPSGPVPEIAGYPTDRAEADGIARAARDARGPHGRWSDQAILVRTNAQVPLIEEALRLARIPSRTRAGSGLLDRPEVRQALRTLTRVHDLRVALADLEADARAGVPAPTDDRDPLDPSDTTGREDAVGGEGVDGIPTIDERQGNLEALVRLGFEYLVLDPTGSGPGFASWLRATVARDPGDERSDAVEIATFHAAKGLEWPIVHVSGLERGLVPISHARSSEAVAEEQRLLYVALTRAEHRLRCTWAAERTFGSRVSARQASPWLPELLTAIASLSGGPPADAPVERLRSARSALHTGTRAEPEVVDPVVAALRRWRSAAARAAAVADRAVLSDETIVELADRRPTTLEELRATPGVGPVRAVRHGDDLLRVLAVAGAGAQGSSTSTTTGA
jgi:DNA helicase-2/ATP-dependent DNA helicase PcrA